MQRIAMRLSVLRQELNRWCFHFSSRRSEDYVHRIGRTGRAGALGFAITCAMCTWQDLSSGPLILQARP
eukprot:3978962-Amphidinium_carterae.1